MAETMVVWMADVKDETMVARMVAWMVGVKG
jgi:hypothetical protein